MNPNENDEREKAAIGEWMDLEIGSLSYNGFCPVSFAREGIIRLASPDVETISFEDKRIGFDCQAYNDVFFKESDIIQKAKGEKPEQFS